MDNTSRLLLRKGVDATLYPLPFKHGGKIVKMAQGGAMNKSEGFPLEDTTMILQDGGNLPPGAQFRKPPMYETKINDNPLTFKDPNMRRQYAIQKVLNTPAQDSGTPNPFIQKFGSELGSMYSAGKNMLGTGFNAVRKAWDSLDTLPQGAAPTMGRALPNMGGPDVVKKALGGTFDSALRKGLKGYGNSTFGDKTVEPTKSPSPRLSFK